jgi:DNA-binding CsgD family transcriptional regulator/DNA polymerase III delta prime subunit
MLLGREAEQQILDELLHQARSGRSAVLALRGEPGIGKTALLDYAHAKAPDMTVLRCVGIEAEHEFPFAGLHQLLRPCLGLLDRLPVPQAAALRGAFGLSFDRVEHPFLVSLAVLSLLAEACDEAPVLCLVDDAHWIDRPSQEALAFAARRLEAEPVVVLMAARSTDRRKFGAAGLPELEVHGLGEHPARALLETRLRQPASAEVVTMLVHTARGNPLALLELPMALTNRQLRGADPIAGPLRAKGAVEQSFRIRVARLPASARRALLLAAAEEGGDLHTLQPALERCGLTVSALEAAEDAGLVQVDGAVVFRHPLVRSAVYGSATRLERRAAHQALAAVLDDPLRSAWHRALAAERADETIAAELDAAAVQAAARGAQATAAAAAERAAELSQQAPRKGRRLTYAAQASAAAGFSDAALALVDRARPLVTDQADIAELAIVSATVSLRHGPPTDTFALLKRAASALAEAEPERALQIIPLMVLAAAAGAWMEDGITDARRMLDRIRGGGARHDFLRRLLDGGRALLDGNAALGHKHLSDAMRIAVQLDGDIVMATMAGLFGLWVADFTPARDRFARIAAQHRAEGSLTGLAGALFFLAVGELCVGRIQAGLDAAAEGLELARQLGYENDETSCLALYAWITAQMGKEQESRECAAAAMRRGLAAGIGFAPSEAHLALGVLEVQLGNAAEAIEHLEQMDPGPLPPSALLATPELIDAALRLGEQEKAARALARFAAWAPASGTALVNGMLARCRGVMTDDDQQADELFAEALRHHDHRVPPYERARTQLAYGERLRRSRRRAEARIQLRSALDTFDGVGAALWAERARAELRATGETARKRDVSTLEMLTPQELRVARLVAAGSTNKDVAAQLFLSSRTVEYHLGKVFNKLGVASRVELARAALDPSFAGQAR